MGIDIQENHDSNVSETINTPPQISPRSPGAHRCVLKWKGDSTSIQHSPYATKEAVEAARVTITQDTIQSVASLHCGGRTHLHITNDSPLPSSEAQRPIASFTFSGRNETTGVLKLVGRVAVRDGEEQKLVIPVATEPGKWRNTAIRVLMQDMLDTGCLRIACIKVSQNSVECLLSANEAHVFSSSHVATMQLGAKLA